MKITIPNFKTFNISDYNYLIAGTAILLCQQDRNVFIKAENGEKVILPEEFHVIVFNNIKTSTPLTTGILIKPR